MEIFHTGHCVPYAAKASNDTDSGVAFHLNSKIQDTYRAYDSSIHFPPTARQHIDALRGQQVHENHDIKSPVPATAWASGDAHIFVKNELISYL